MVLSAYYNTHSIIMAEIFISILRIYQSKRYLTLMKYYQSAYNLSRCWREHKGLIGQCPHPQKV